MKTLKKFFKYFLLLVGFLVISLVVEDKILTSMYKEIEGTSIDTDTLAIEVADARATSENGYLDLKVTNTSGEYIDSAYAKIDLLNEFDNVVMTEYATIEDLEPGESKNVRIKYNGVRIAGYDVSTVPELPDKSNIINIFGWEFDTSKILGSNSDDSDDSSFTIFGVDLGKYISKSNLNKAKRFLVGRWKYGLSIARAVPLWGYICGALVVLWYL